MAVRGRRFRPTLTKDIQQMFHIFRDARRFPASIPERQRLLRSAQTPVLLDIAINVEDIALSWFHSGFAGRPVLRLAMPLATEDVGSPRLFQIRVVRFGCGQICWEYWPTPATSAIREFKNPATMVLTMRGGSQECPRRHRM